MGGEERECVNGTRELDKEGGCWKRGCQGGEGREVKMKAETGEEEGS